MSDAHSAAVIPVRATAVDAYADLFAFLFADIEGFFRDLFERGYADWQTTLEP
jgi:hypothetical protein